MRHRLFKMLMNAEGSSPGGGGQQPPPPGTPPAPAAQAGAASPGLTVDQVKSLFAEQAKEIRNGVFADLRRQGLLKGKDPDAGAGSGAGDGGDKPPGPAPTPGVSADDVQKLITRERSIERIATENKLSDGQRRRMEVALKAENPSDVAAWSKSYLEDMGIVKAQPSQTPNGGASAGAGAPRGPSQSDRGAPGRDSSLVHEGQVWKMTPAEVQALIREKGYQAAAHELRARLKADLRGVRLLLPRPGS